VALFAVVAGLGGLDAALMSALFTLGLGLDTAASGFGGGSVFLIFSVNSGGDESANRESENETEVFHGERRGGEAELGK